MKNRSLISWSLLCLGAGTLSAGIRFGMADAVRAQVKELDKKVHKGSFQFVNGPTVSGSGAGGLSARGRQPRATIKVDGSKWVVSPDKVRFRVTNAVLTPLESKPPRTINFNACTVTYDRAINSKSVLLNCPFTIPDGNYREITVAIDPTLEVYINDSVNGIYTDPTSPTKISMTPPADGAQFVSYTAPSSSLGGLSGIITNTSLNKTLEVNEDNPNPVIQLVIDTTRTMRTTVSGTEMSFSDPMGAMEVPILVVPFASGLASAKIYTTAAYPEFNMEYYTPGNPEIMTQTVKIFYESDGQPSVIHHQTGDWPVVDQLSTGAGVFRRLPPQNGSLPSYLGRDNSGTIGFATLNNDTAYMALVSMSDPSTLGDTTVINYKLTASPPAPTSGNDYSSGVPNFTPDGQVTLELIAH